MSMGRTGKPVKAAIWLRVSDPEQQTANQLQPLRDLAERRGWEVVKVYDISGVSAFGGQHERFLQDVVKDARRNMFSVLLVWSLDRLTRQGVGPMFEVIKRFQDAGVDVVSLQEPWTEVEASFKDLLLSVVAWVAEFESQRRSERTKAGLANAVERGQKLGRPKGSTNKKKRRRQS